MPHYYLCHFDYSPKLNLLRHQHENKYITCVVDVFVAVDKDAKVASKGFTCVSDCVKWFNNKAEEFTP